VLFNGRRWRPAPQSATSRWLSVQLYPHLNVYDNIAFPLRAPRWGLKLSHAEERAKVGEIANFLGIGELLERLPQHLSGGQKQRVSLARALVRKPEVYLLDEPIAHLDARLKFSTQSLLKDFAAKYRATIIYVTHDYREAWPSRTGGCAKTDRAGGRRTSTIAQSPIYGPPDQRAPMTSGRPDRGQEDGAVSRPAAASPAGAGAYRTPCAPRAPEAAAW
jgi:hypothetical protein